MEKKLTNEQLSEIQKYLDENGGLLEIREKSSEYIGVNYEVVIKNNPYVDSTNHPINLTNEYIEMIESVISEEVWFNDTKTIFWLS